MNKEVVLGFARHVLTAAGGGLATNGTMTGDELGQGIGALLTLAGIAWSIWAKRKQKES